MSDKTALEEAISVIMSYECDIRDCKNQYGIDLVKIGFCQGSVYKNARRIIKKKREEKESTIAEDLIVDLKNTMRNRGLNPEDISKMIGCSFKQVYRWLGGESVPTFLYRKAILKAIEDMKERQI